MQTENRKLTLKNYIGYGTMDLFGGGAFAIIGAWMLYFFITYCGLTPVEAGSIIAIARIIDAIASPIMGHITDNFGRTKLGKKFGRRRFFLLVGSPLMVIYSLLWISDMNYWYYLTVYILLEFLAAMVLIPFETLGAEMTNDFNARTKLSTIRLIYSGLGTFLATFIPGRLFEIFGKDSPQVFLYNGIIFTFIFMAALLITHRTTWERKIEEDMIEPDGVEKAPAIESIKKVIIDLTSTFRIRSFRQHLTMYICSFTAMDILNAVFVYFVVFSLNKDAVLAADLLSIGSLLQMVCTILFGWLVIKIGPAPSLKISYIAIITCISGYIFLYFTQPTYMIIALYAFSVILGIGKSGLYYIPWNIYTFIPDVDEMVTRKRREGIFAGIMTFTRKSTTALATFLVGVILQETGFVASATTQSTTAINGIVGILFFGTVGLVGISLVISFKFKLSKKTHSIMINEINRLKNNGSMEQADNETRSVLKALTGWDYEKLWGNNNVGYQNKLQNLEQQDFKQQDMN
ncbi:MFS transporter [Bacillus altitudinis]|uniref:MFS transporter n=1 Tax=Bacillus altitudinis TaxID=293387 RepID=UPI00397D66C8